MRFVVGVAVGATVVITAWWCWRPALRYLLSRGDEPFHP